MSKHHAFTFLVSRLAQAHARNAVAIRTARTAEERLWAEGQREVLNEISGWVVVAFGKNSADTPHSFS